MQLRKKLVNQTDHLVIQCDDISDVSDQYDMAVTFRFLQNEIVQDRFWPFLSLAGETPEVMIMNA